MESPLESLRTRWRRLRRPALLRYVQGTKPLSRRWGYDRGNPVDRYYVESFIKQHCLDIHGHVLEIQNDAYTKRFGINVTQSDVLDVDAQNPHATIVTDLMCAKNVPDDSVDCLILTQTLQFLFDPRVALTEVRRFLRRGGVVLATMPGVSRIDGALAHVDYWRFTPASAQKLFSDCFGAGTISMRAYGNVLTAMAFLTGMTQEEFSRQQLDEYDERFPVIVAVRARKI